MRDGDETEEEKPDLVLEHAGAILLTLSAMVSLMGTRETYSDRELALDGWGKPCDVRSENARRWDLSGGLTRVVDDLWDDSGKYRKIVLSGYAFQRRGAARRARHSLERARVMYSVTWGLLVRAADDEYRRPLWSTSGFSLSEAMRVIDRARVIVTSRVSGAHVPIPGRERPLGQAGPRDPKRPEELELLARVTELAGEGYELPSGDVPMILACYGLVRRGLVFMEENTTKWILHPRST